MSNAVTYIMIYFLYIHTFTTTHCVLCVASSGWVQYSLTVSIALYTYMCIDVRIYIFTRYGGKYNMKHFHSYSYLNDYRISRRLIIVQTYGICMCVVYSLIYIYKLVLFDKVYIFFFRRLRRLRYIYFYLVFDLSFKIIPFLSTFSYGMVWYVEYGDGDSIPWERTWRYSVVTKSFFYWLMNRKRMVVSIPKCVRFWY